MSITIRHTKLGIFVFQQVWFNREPVFTPVNSATVYLLNQSVPIASFSRGVCLNQSIFPTSVIDLTVAQEELWKALDPKSCRYEIRKVKKLIDAGQSVQVKYDTDLADYLQVANSYIREKRYSKPLKLSNFSRYTDYGCANLATIYYDQQLVGGNFYLLDQPDRVRLLYSFNNRFEGGPVESISGPLMRFLHWELMTKYKIQGIHWYDMGGVNLDKQSVAYGITQFKLSFGGQLREEYNYTVAGNRFVGRLYKLYQSISHIGLRQSAVRD